MPSHGPLATCAVLALVLAVPSCVTNALDVPSTYQRSVSTTEVYSSFEEGESCEHEGLPYSHGRWVCKEPEENGEYGVEYNMEQKYKHQCLDGEWVNSGMECDAEEQALHRSSGVVTVDITEFEQLEENIVNGLIRKGKSPNWWYHFRDTSEHDLRTFPDGYLYQSRKGLWVRIRRAGASGRVYSPVGQSSTRRP